MHTKSRKTSWVKPEGFDPSKAAALADEWLELKDPKSSRVYYMNAATRRTSWVKPKGKDAVKKDREDGNSAEKGQYSAKYFLTIFSSFLPFLR